jgi:BirA family biotin operon repressor/biotin-[acetyl-CoA-carboxylase] ligase
MSLRRRLLSLLSDGDHHSGEALGAALGVSRMAVWKHIKALHELGIDISVQRGKGYRLPATLELLERERILAATASPCAKAISDIHVHLEVDSTNNWLREVALNGAASGTVCVAEMQSAGRGRRGRTWVSPFAASLYLSLLWRANCGAAALGGLSLVTGIAILRALQSLGIEGAGLKWPNDVLAGRDKLAGVLIDVVGESNGPCALIIGVGINMNMPGEAAHAIDQSWTDLRRLDDDTVFSRNELAGRVLTELIPVMELFEREGLQPFLDDWRRYDLVSGQRVDLLLPNERISGTACGIDDGGALLVNTRDGRRRFLSGDVSLRVAS